MSSKTCKPRRELLSAIESIADIGNGEKKYPGIMILFRVDGRYVLHWGPLGGATPSAIFADQENMDLELNSWSPGQSFNVDCRNLSYLVFEEKPLSMVIFGGAEGMKRNFILEENEFISLAEFCEQIIINFVALPSDESRFSLSFYPKCGREASPCVPLYLQLPIMKNCELSCFWDHVLVFYDKLVPHLERSNVLPTNSAFPIVKAARAANNKVFREMEHFFSQLPMFEPVSAENWDSFFDEEGRIIDHEKFRMNLYLGGINDDILARALPFIFGLYGIDTDSKQREKQRRIYIEEFNIISMQLESLENTQINNNKKMSNYFKIIVHDISRTDRQEVAFKDENKPGLCILLKLLKMYSIFNPTMGYIQGMNDLFVPIIMAYLPHWDEDGNPIQSDGSTVEFEKFLPDIFWCFDALLKNTRHDKFLSSITEHCQHQSQIIHQIIYSISPIAAIWMKKNQLSDLLWLYSDMVLLFKRSFKYIWTIWLQINCSSNPCHWLTYFVASLILNSFSKISSLTDTSIPVIMDAFPKMMSSIDLKHIGKMSLYLETKYELNNDDYKNTDRSQYRFRYFEPNWTE